MASNLDRYRRDLSKLIEVGNNMFVDLYLQSMEKSGQKLDKSNQEAKKKVTGKFATEYQKWYTEAFAVMRQLLPDRLSEFEALYKADPKRKTVNATTYKIQDWLLGLRAVRNKYTGEMPYDDSAAVTMCFSVQFDILKSVAARFESSLFDVKQVLQADLFDSELEAARELLKSGFVRAAGVVGGVVLESHLSQVCSNHGITLKKKDPSITDYNDLLRSNDVIDVPQLRFVQRLGDLRNLCGHKKHRDPTSEEVAELIDGVEKTTKTLY
jgi:hypothetical protein